MQNIPGVQKRGENSYFFTVSLGRGADGKYKRKTKTFRVTEKLTPKQEEEFIRHAYMNFKQKVQSGAYVTPGRMLFKDFAEEWKKRYAFVKLADTTIESRESMLNNHILPVIGHIRIDKINTFILMDLINNATRKDGKKTKDGKEIEASGYVKELIHTTLKSIFKKAVKWKAINENPMEGVSKPKRQKGNNRVKELNVYDEKEVTTLLEKAQDELPHWRIFISLTLTAGLRRGEALGLEWSAVDLENGIIDIRQSIVRGREGSLIKEPKADSKRLISLPPTMIEDLKRFKIHWKKEKLKLADMWTEHEKEWLFCNNEGTHFYPTSPTTWWGRFTARTGVRHIRLHDLRHTSATLLIAKNVHAKLISERLGHSRIGITMDTYGHALRTADKEAANKLEDIFNNTNM